MSYNSFYNHLLKWQVLMLKNLLTHAGILEKDIQYPNLPNESLERQRIQSPTEICYSSYWCRPPPRLQSSLALTCEIQTELRTFINQNWKVALYKCPPPTSLNMVHQTVEGCSETSPLYICVHKSGDIESISLSEEMFSGLEGGFAVMGGHMVELKKDFDFCVLY